ncbi:uncharacterized protein LOC118262035 isoform X2 [Spodoptera frugiperda]|uniref:Uncharacterized protein LOC118262035 isoform X2 n=1 Tax=Spodoptera frugiperda TaxID=7108 RepID=A0A9R0F0W8_SPOFR|nr:uncharacterized protein LOC118262035 isoform X2 [Spodoptera frugiperda]XP_050557641.1 uncharacterized protein LOC118262035 isoform X2 [Spodoptera frugiperda]
MVTYSYHNTFYCTKLPTSNSVPHLSKSIRIIAKMYLSATVNIIVTVVEKLDLITNRKNDSIQPPHQRVSSNPSKKKLRKRARNMFDVPTSLQPDIHIPSRTTIIIMQPESDYELGDPYIAEKKTQKTSSNKAVVKGIYSLDQPDDSVKIAEYTDKKSGFIFQIFPRLIQNQRDII